jgi:hypothetical protein
MTWGANVGICTRESIEVIDPLFSPESMTPKLIEIVEMFTFCGFMRCYR